MAWLNEAKNRILTRRDVRRRVKITVGTTSVGQYEDVVTEEYFFPALTEEVANAKAAEYKNKPNVTAVVSRQNDSGAYRVDVSERSVTDVPME